jgi:hypothetical protein
MPDSPLGPFVSRNVLHKWHSPVFRRRVSRAQIARGFFELRYAGVPLHRQRQLQRVIRCGVALVAIRNSRPSRQAGDALPASGGDASISRQDKVAFAKLYSSLENIHYFGFVLQNIQLKIVNMACCNQRTLPAFASAPNLGSQNCGVVALAVHTGPWPEDEVPLAPGSVRVSAALVAAASDALPGRKRLLVTLT